MSGPFKMNGYTYPGISPVKHTEGVVHENPHPKTEKEGKKKTVYKQGKVPSEDEQRKRANDKTVVKDADYYAWQMGLTPA
jgi:hypothetical protein